MRLDPVLDAVYALGSLWGTLSAPQVCPMSSPARPRAVSEVSWSSGSGAVPAAVTAFVDVNVIPMDQERVLTNQTVLVEGGKITALGPVNQVRVPTEAARVDGRGKYLMPGLTDMHAHLRLFFNDDNSKYGEVEVARRFFTYLAHGVTTVRNLGPEGNDFLRLRSADVLGPRLYLSNGIPGVTLPIPRLDSVAAYVSAYKAAGYDYFYIKAPMVMTHLPPESRAVVDSVLAAGRRVGLPLSSHLHAMSFEDFLVLGAYGGSVEHLYAFQEFFKEPKAGAPAVDVQAIAAATKRAGTWVSMTLGCLEYGNSPSGDVTVGRRLIKALQEAGVGLLLGADSPGGIVESPSGVHVELASLVRAGLSPYQALLTGTRNVAQFMGLLDSAGTVAVGKRADLVLLYGNPLQDIRHTREPAGVMSQGRWLDRARLDQGLLAPPSRWFELDVKEGPLQREATGPHYVPFRMRMNTFGALVDALELARSMGPEGANEVQRLQSLMAADLGAMRAFLTPEQHVTFDPIARVWLREQARQGHPVVVPGILPVPSGSVP